MMKSRFFVRVISSYAYPLPPHIHTHLHPPHTHTQPTPARAPRTATQLRNIDLEQNEISNLLECCEREEAPPPRPSPSARHRALRPRGLSAPPQPPPRRLLSVSEPARSAEAKNADNVACGAVDKLIAAMEGHGDLVIHFGRNPDVSPAQFKKVQALARSAVMSRNHRLEMQQRTISA